MEKKKFDKYVAEVRRSTRLSRQFDEVVEFYHDSKANTSSYGNVSYEAEGGAGSSSYVVGRVVMSHSDFTADVEIAAVRVLGPKQLRFFREVYLSGDFTLTQSKPNWYKQLDTEVRGILGQEFKERGIYPAASYMQVRRT